MVLINLNKEELNYIKNEFERVINDNSKEFKIFVNDLGKVTVDEIKFILKHWDKVENDMWLYAHMCNLSEKVLYFWLWIKDDYTVEDLRELSTYKNDDIYCSIYNKYLNEINGED